MQSRCSFSQLREKYMYTAPLIRLICKISNSHKNIFPLNILQMSNNVELSSSLPFFVRQCFPDDSVDFLTDQTRLFSYAAQSMFYLQWLSKADTWSKTRQSLATWDNLYKAEIYFRSHTFLILDFNLIFQIENVSNYLMIKLIKVSTTLSFSAAIPLESTGGQEVEFYSTVSDLLPGSCPLRRIPTCCDWCDLHFSTQWYCLGSSNVRLLTQ